MKRILTALLLIMLFVFSATAQKDIYARQIKIRGRGAKLDGAGNIPLYWNGFYYGTYSGNTRDAFFYNYTGTGHYVFNWQVNGQPTFVMNEAGRVVLLGHFRVAGATSYFNFGNVFGTSGFGFRNNAGTIQFKNSGGAWAGVSGLGGDPTFNSVTITGLTASRLISTSAVKLLESSDATAWIGGTVNNVTVGDDLDGSVTLSTVTLGDIVVVGTGMSGGANNILPGADVDTTITLTTLKDLVAGTGLTGGANDILPGGDSDVTINADANLLVAGTANRVIVTDDLDGTITLSTPQDIHTGASPTFNSITITGTTAAGRFVNSTITTFVDQDTTPTVVSNNIFKTGNTLATIITTFDNGTNGQKITVIFGDAVTTITDGANLYLQGGINFTSTADDVMEFIYDGISWYECTRSLN